MIRNMHGMSDAERAAAMPDPQAKLVSMGEVTTYVPEFTNHGQRQVPVTFEILVEWKFDGGGRKAWYRFKDRPNELVAQFDCSPAPPPVPCEVYSEAELAAIRSSLPKKDPPTETPPSKILFEAPNW